jgi:Tol biopolymer transport system component
MRAIQAAVIVLWLFAGTAFSQLRLRPFLGLPGETSDPAISPDGKTIVFDWWTPDINAWGLYTRAMSGGEPELFAQGGDFGITESPKWSPDGKWIAFLRSGTPRTASLFIKPATGGEERALGTVCNNAVAWTADSRFLVTPNNGDTDSLDECRLTVISTQPGGSSRQLADRGIFPSVSRDGKVLAFARNHEIHLLPIAPDGRALGPDITLIREAGTISQITWDSRSNEILYLVSEDRSVIHRIEARQGARPRAAETIDGEFNMVSLSGDRSPVLAEVETYDNSFWKIDLQSAKPRFEKIRGLHWNVGNLRLSPDGRTSLYSVHSGGHSELFTSNLDGSEPRHLLTIPYERIEQISWSSDGKQIAFTAEPVVAQVEPLHLFIASASAGMPRRAGDQFDDVQLIGWSEDGQSLYFSAGIQQSLSAGIARGEWPVWKLNIVTNQSIQVAKLAANPVGLVNGYIYQRLNLVPFSLLRSLLVGGPEEHIFDQAFNLAIGKNYIFFLRQDAKPPTPDGLNLYRLDLATRTPEFITNAGFAAQLQLSADARSLYAERHEPPRRDIMLVQNGR